MLIPCLKENRPLNYLIIIELFKAEYIIGELNNNIGGKYCLQNFIFLNVEH